MSSKQIGYCEYCGDSYCMECSNAEDGTSFCSGECEDANEKQESEE